MKNSWLFPVIEAAHVMGLAMFVGTLVLRDFGTAGLGRWTRWGLIVMLATGPTMFLADRTRYLHNPAFLVKMALLLLAAAVYRWRVKPWLSLGLWTAVVLAARAIADFDL